MILWPTMSSQVILELIFINFFLNGYINDFLNFGLVNDTYSVFKILSANGSVWSKTKYSNYITGIVRGQTRGKLTNFNKKKII